VESEASEAASTVLADLIAAGLVSHEMIGDPARLGSEAACLRALCALVCGPVYRIDAYHYAFRAEPGDLDGRLKDMVPGAWTEAIAAALGERLGEDSVWINATDLLPEAEAALAQPILLVRAQDTAITGALESAGPELQAVINARYAAECARLTLEQISTSGIGGGLAERLSRIEAEQIEFFERQASRQSGLEETLAGLSATLSGTMAAILQRLESQADLLQGHITQESRMSDQSARDVTAATEAFRETLGVTFAEFLARLEQRAEEDRAALRIHNFN
jgi:hypothetical protein